MLLLLQWLDSVTKQNEGNIVERAKDKEPGVSTEQLSEASENTDSARMWVPRENVELTLIAAYTRRQRASRCST